MEAEAERGPTSKEAEPEAEGGTVLDRMCTAIQKAKDGTIIQRPRALVFVGACGDAENIDSGRRN